MSLADVTSVNLSAADGAFASENGGIDARVVWDPYFALGQARTETRVPAYGGDILPHSASFLLANSVFAASHPELVRELIDGSAEAGHGPRPILRTLRPRWHRRWGSTRSSSPRYARTNFDVVPLSVPILSTQQRTADRLTKARCCAKTDSSAGYYLAAAGMTSATSVL